MLSNHFGSSASMCSLLGRSLCIVTVLFTLSLGQLTAATEANDDTKNYLMDVDRHLLFRRADITDLMDRPLLERRSLDNEEIIDLDESGDVASRNKAVKMHNLFGRTIPLRSDKVPFSAKIFRVGGSTPLFKARSFGDNNNYRDALKRILLRMN